MESRPLKKFPLSTDGKKRVLIIGAGFGGLNAAKELGPHSEIEVILVDQRNYHLFQPLLYQVATAGLSPADIAVPIRSEVKNFPNIAVHMGVATHINVKESFVIVNDAVQIYFDYLIAACGSHHSYFGKNQWEENAPGLKTLEQATEIRRRILLAFEMAENEMDPVTQQQLLTFIVVGGGPTGVELAGALGEISRSVLIQDFRRIETTETRIILIEAGPRILPTFNEALSHTAERDLRGLGVDVMTNTRVTSLDADGVTAGHQRINAKTIIWAAGVQPSPLANLLGEEVDRSGRVHVQLDLSLKSSRNIFVIGDMAHFKGPSGQPLPGLAPVALQQGRHAARNILLKINNQPTEVFRYYDKGQMATIGKHRAIVQKNKLEFSGWLAWVAWLIIHIYYLVGFRNRISVLAQWAWSFLFSKRSARLIVNKSWRSFESQAPTGKPGNHSEQLPPSHP